MKWQQITVQTTPDFADMVSYILTEAGSEGVVIKDNSDIRLVLDNDVVWDYADEEIFEDDGRSFVSGFYPEGYSAAGILELLEDLKKNCGSDTGSLELSSELIDSADWENEWKKYYSPIEFDNFAIVPKWINYGGEKLPVYLDPGMAFGTGTHETTRMCLRFLDKLQLKGKVCFDIGCGSGILGIASAKLGAEKCYLTDIDETAINSAAENLRLNNIGENRVELLAGDLDSVIPERQKADIITANITADILLRLKDSIARRLSGGGKLIISGIISSRMDEVFGAYSEKFDLIEAASEGEWHACVLSAAE